VAVSELDAEQLNRLSGRHDVVYVPNGVDTDYFRLESVEPDGKSNPTLIYVGGFTWFPNLDAIDYFRREILPIVQARVPNVKLKVIGRYPDTAQVREIAADPAIELCGLVDDIRPHVQAAGVYIVPLRIGGGTRLKILDALSMAKAIVSTSIGCEGLDVVPGESIIVADEPKSFADALIRLFNDPQAVQRIGQNGRALAEARYDWRAVAKGLDAAYQRAVATGPATLNGPR
jgi:glycosyltransferase involved in cell wall biosynthesis